ncbi:MAG: hypothetical protein MSG64_05400 [Pyrinomonadaceae bacterium MAG19_C2-C3]|nr:hypothetical protein [Pyrinomonadaceae bacterium MAG19_C2-C3]
MKLIATLLFTVTISVIGAVLEATNSSNEPVTNTPIATSFVKEKADPPGTIDGSKEPHKIPDHVPYLVLFRLIAYRPNEVEKDKMLDYLDQHVDLKKSKCKTCPKTEEDNDVDALLAAADEFKQRISVLDNQANAIKDQHWPDPSPEVMAQLTTLQQQKEALVMEIANSLQYRLSTKGKEKVSKHVKENMKRKMKLTLGPKTAPSGNDWEQHPKGHTSGHH